MKRLLVLTVYATRSGEIEYHADGEGVFERDLDPSEVGEVLHRFRIQGRIVDEDDGDADGACDECRSYGPRAGCEHSSGRSHV